MALVKYVDRKNTNCEKWDGLIDMYGQDNLLSMWVADMDFQVPDCVIAALQSYVTAGTFGYYRTPDSYYDAFINWEKEQHGFEVQKEWIRFSPGVVSAFYWIVQFMTNPGDAVIVTTPVYYPFMNSVKDNGRKLITSDLLNTNGTYSVDFADFEKKIVENDVKLFILCSPHNPVGRVWTYEELKTLFDICRKHNVFVISDEIHHDLVFSEYAHIPSLTVGNYSDMMIMLTAPSKTFNLAACQNSVIVIPDEEIREKWDTFTGNLRVTDGNSFGYIAAEAAYTGGHAWYEEMKEIVYGNYQYMKDSFAKELPDVSVSPLEGTYLAWIDMRHYLKPEEMTEFMQEKCDLAFDYGDWFGGENFAGFIRMNLATKRENVEMAVQRIMGNLE